MNGKNKVSSTNMLSSVVQQIKRYAKPERYGFKLKIASKLPITS